MERKYIWSFQEWYRELDRTNRHDTTTARNGWMGWISFFFCSMSSLSLFCFSSVTFAQKERDGDIF